MTNAKAGRSQAEDNAIKAEKAEATRKARERLDTLIAALIETCDPETLVPVWQAMVEANVKDVGVERELKRIKEKTRYSIKGLHEGFSAYVKANAEAKGESTADNTDYTTSEKIAAAIATTRKSADPFKFPPPDYGQFVFGVRGERPWLFRTNGKDATAICTPLMLNGPVRYPDRGNYRAIRAEVFNAENEWAQAEIKSTDLAQPSGNDLIKVLMDAGLGGRARQAYRQAASGTKALLDLGSGQGNGCSSQLHHCHQCAGLLLRSSQPLATRHQRKHQRPAAPVLSKGNRPLSLLPSSAQQDRAAAQSTSEKNLGLQIPSR